MSILSEPHFHNEKAAFAKLESIVWPNGPICPKCGGLDRNTKVGGKAARAGLWRCLDCKRQFTCTVGTVFERSHVKLHLWFQAAHLMASSKKGISAHQLHRTLRVHYRTAWFMEHRLREAMRSDGLSPLGGEGKIVESDETFIGRKKGARKGYGVGHKMKVLSLVERGGPVRSIVMDDITRAEIERVVKANVARESRLMTDMAPYYRKPLGFADHGKVDHSAGEYVNGDAHVNTLESFFSVFKRGMKGVYQHCSEKHLHRYMAEFDFRYNNRAKLGVDDATRAAVALRGIVGRRLLYRDSSV
jgi:transposase-like protein